MTLYRLLLLKIYNISDESCRENQNTQFMITTIFSPQKLRCLRDNVEEVQSIRQQMTKRPMSVACCEPESTNTHSEHILITAFPLQNLLRERP
jgi:hypothetical protein